MGTIEISEKLVGVDVLSVLDLSSAFRERCFEFFLLLGRQLHDVVDDEPKHGSLRQIGRLIENQSSVPDDRADSHAAHH